jgi:membrane associated rhomboid family serine protease
LGAYIVSFPLRWGALLFIAVWAGSQFLNGYGSLLAAGTGPSGGTAYFAHIGGFACGVLAVAAFRHGDAGTRAQRWY